MNSFEQTLAANLGEARLVKIQGVKVGLAGAGGLGSNCAQFLVRSGFKQLKIIDYDHVEISNINRQFFFLHQQGKPKVEALRENLLQINPDIILDVQQLKIDETNVSELFCHCDVVIEALDQAAYKRMVVETYLPTDKLLVAASGLAGWGRTEGIMIHRRKAHFFLVGDLVSEVSPHCPPMAPGVTIAAAKQADIVLNYFLSKGDGDGEDS